MRWPLPEWRGDIFSPPAPPTSRRRRRGMTLVEILVATAVSLLIMFALVSVFAFMGDFVTAGRASIELQGQLRAVAQRLQQDLDGCTVPVRPVASTTVNNGYFEYCEGRLRDSNFEIDWDNDAATPLLPHYAGDLDDFFALTTRSRAAPFRGRLMTQNGLTIIESDLAEVIWWTRFNDKDGNGQMDAGETVTLYRRVLLIRPDLNMASYTNSTNLAEFYATSDISVRVEDGKLAGNSLADLTKRENRFAHLTNAYPYLFDRSLLNSRILQGDSLGDDVILTNVAAFDVRLYDPLAQIQGLLASGDAVEPSDVGYVATGAGIGNGTFVDLNYGNNGNLSYFSGPPHPRSKLVNAANNDIYYDTGSLHYEYDGINQADWLTDGVGNPITATDEGTDGLDNDGKNGADDPLERETYPPYAWPVRGAMVILRVYDDSTRLVRQTSVVTDFTPE
jgi:type II secretory pathway pseudopilin PulG